MNQPEGFVLDPTGAAPLDLGNGGALRLAALTIPPAQKLPAWASNGDTDGQALVRNPYHDNRACTMQVRVAATSMDDAMDALGVLQGKLQEACVQGADNGPGLPFLWTPAGATTGLTGYMLFAEITDMPVTEADGWFANRPVVTISFTAKPFLYGAEVTGPTVTASYPVTPLDIPNVPGDVAAEARLVISDGTGAARRFVEWGLESLHYDPADPAPLYLQSTDLATSGFAGAGSALTGSYNGTAISTKLYSQPTAVCGTGDQPHVGSFRVKARIHAASTDEYWRLTWQEADGDFIPNAYAQPVASNDFSEIDLGIVTIEPVLAGTQSWSGRIEAYTTTAGGEVGAVDYLALIPADEGYGRLEHAYAYQAGVITGFDDFSTGTSGSALSGHVAPTGGTWVTSGTTTDFMFSTDEVYRSTSGQNGLRYAILGSATPTNTEVGVDVTLPAANLVLCQLIARWTDSNNCLSFTAAWQPSGDLALSVGPTVSGAFTSLADVTISTAQTSFSLRLVAYASGLCIATLLDGTTGAQLAQLEGISTSLATGGALASGKAGFGDKSDAAAVYTRTYANFHVSAPAAETTIINAGEAIQIRSNANLRQSADGTTYGDLPSRGSRLFIPPAGTANRRSRIAVRAIRETPTTMASRNDGDMTELAVYYTPRYLGVPRS